MTIVTTMPAMLPRCSCTGITPSRNASRSSRVIAGCAAVPVAVGAGVAAAAGGAGAGVAAGATGSGVVAGGGVGVDAGVGVGVDSAAAGGAVSSGRAGSGIFVAGGTASTGRSDAGVGAEGGSGSGITGTLGAGPWARDSGSEKPAAKRKLPAVTAAAIAASFEPRRIVRARGAGRIVRSGRLGRKVHVGLALGKKFRGGQSVPKSHDNLKSPGETCCRGNRSARFLTQPPSSRTRLALPFFA